MSSRVAVVYASLTSHGCTIPSDANSRHNSAVGKLARRSLGMVSCVVGFPSNCSHNNMNHSGFPVVNRS